MDCPVCTDKEPELIEIYDRFEAQEWWCAACNSCWLASKDGTVYEIAP